LAKRDLRFETHRPLHSVRSDLQAGIPDHSQWIWPFFSSRKWKMALLSDWLDTTVMNDLLQLLTP